MAAPMRVLGLDHVVIRVSDLERAVEFYCGVLGGSVERTLENPKLVQIRAGASLLDLVPGRVPGGAASENLEHFAFRVDPFDPEALRAHLERFGAGADEVKERYGSDGFGPSIYFFDPDGNKVEFKGPPARPPLR